MQYNNKKGYGNGGTDMDNAAFTVKKEKNSNKTIRMQKIADENDTSFNKVVVQCCEYALRNMPKE